MQENAYKDAGVDIEAGATLVERIKPHARATARAGVMGGLGGFGALFDLKQTSYKDPLLVSSTDGVGTKLKLAIQTQKHTHVGQDLVAMCVNDLVVQGAEPLFFLDYFASARLNVEVAETVIAGIARACQDSGCALIGGETAEMPDMYEAEDYDLAGFAVGAVERDRLITGQTITAGDVILGLASHGLHANGFSLVRRILGNLPKSALDAPAPFAMSSPPSPHKNHTPKTTQSPCSPPCLADVLLTPTRLYVRSILDTIKAHEISDSACVIKGLAHITGGGLTENIPRILPESCTAHLNMRTWDIPPVFGWLKHIGNLHSLDMISTFNCGIGMILVCAPEKADSLTQHLRNHGESVYTIGEIAPKTDAPLIVSHTEDVWDF